MICEHYSPIVRGGSLCTIRGVACDFAEHDSNGMENCQYRNGDVGFDFLVINAAMNQTGEYGLNGKVDVRVNGQPVGLQRLEQVADRYIDETIPSSLGSSSSNPEGSQGTEFEQD